MDAAYEHLGLNPFGDASQQFNFYPTSMHRQVLMRISRGLESSCGLVLLTGEIGIGKTTLSRHIQQQFANAFTFAELGNPYLSPAEQLFHFCQRFGVELDPGAGAKEQMDALSKHLLEMHKAGKRPVMIIDESHLLTRAHFGQVLVFSNLRFDAAPLVQILFVGQLEIMDRLREMGLEALNQRIGVRCELRPLNLDETRDYIRFKLESAGLENPDLFSGRAVERIWKISGGLPRLINHICAHAFDQLAFSGKEAVDPDMIDAVGRDGMYQELFTTRTKKPSTWKRVWPAAALTVLVAAVAVAAALYGPGIMARLTRGEPAPQVAAVPAPTPPDQAAPPQVEPPVPAPAPTPPPAPTPAAAEPVVQAPPDPGPEAAHPAPEPAPKAEPEPAQAAEPRAPGASQDRADDGKDTIQQSDIPSIADGSDHPVVGKIAVDAVAWSANAPERLVVLNEKIMREGDSLGKVRLDFIGREYLVFSYQGTRYKRRWHP